MSFAFHFCAFSYSEVCSDLYKLSLSDVIVFKKGSTGDGKFTLCGWDFYFPCSLSTDLHYCDRKRFESIVHQVSHYIFVQKYTTKE